MYTIVDRWEINPKNIFNTIEEVLENEAKSEDGYRCNFAIVKLEKFYKVKRVTAPKWEDVEITYEDFTANSSDAEEVTCSEPFTQTPA